MSKKKIPLTIDEHLKLAKDLRAAQEILQPWLDRFYKAYSVNGKEVNQLWRVLNLLSSQICNTQDDQWFRITDKKTPYYGNGKRAYIE